MERGFGEGSDRAKERQSCQLPRVGVIWAGLSVRMESGGCNPQ